MLNIAFIRPAMMGKPSGDAMMPLVFAIIKPLTPPDVNITFYDERSRALPRSIEADAVAITVETFMARRAYELADTFRALAIPVIMGGFHPTMLVRREQSAEALAHADVLVSGEAENTWPLIMEDLKAGTLKQIYISTNNGDLAKTKYDYSVFKGMRYNRIGMVQHSRGCKYSCEFCSVHAFFGNTVRQRSITDTVADIKAQGKFFLFVDDNLFLNEAQAEQLFLALVPLKKKWACQISIDIAERPELLRLMKKSGCILVLIGFESLDQQNLSLMGKRANLRAVYEKAVQNIYDAGLMIYGTFIFGYDNDNEVTMRASRDFAETHNFAVANFNPLMVLPDTPLYERFLREKRLRSEKWWRDPDYRYGASMHIPARISAEVLHNVCKSARFGFYAIGSILRRLFRCKVNRKNALLYVAANIISRKEIHAKQDELLGGKT